MYMIFMFKIINTDDLFLFKKYNIYHTSILLYILLTKINLFYEQNDEKRLKLYIARTSCFLTLITFLSLCQTSLNLFTTFYQ